MNPPLSLVQDCSKTPNGFFNESSFKLLLKDNHFFFSASKSFLVANSKG